MNAADARPRTATGRPFIQRILAIVSARRDQLMLLIFIGLLYFYLRLFQNALVDDAFISLQYVRTLIQHGSWGYFAGHVTNTATSPLNVLLLASISLLTGRIVESPVWLTLVCFVALAVTLDRISLQVLGSRWFGWLATTAFVLNPLLISTLGLESILLSTLLAVALWCFLTGKWSWLGLALGMLSITRADGLLFALIFLFALPTTAARQRSLLTLFLSAAPWYFYSWIGLGSFVPDTLLIRLSDASWQESTFLDGPRLFMIRYPIQALLSISYLPLVLTLLSRQVRNTPVIRLILALGVAHFMAYALLHVPPYHWYYAPEAALIILLGMLGMGIVYQAWQTTPRLRLAGQGIVLLAILGPLIGMTQFLAANSLRVTEMPIHSNLASQAQFMEAGLWLKDYVGERSVLQEGEIGTLAYYCECHLLDPFSDRTWLQGGVHRTVAAGGVRAAVYRANFLFLHDDAAFPQYSYVLEVRERRGGPGATDIKRWLTSSTWAPQSDIVLKPY